VSEYVIRGGRRIEVETLEPKTRAAYEAAAA
jgi:hypothetical protein